MSPSFCPCASGDRNKKVPNTPRNLTWNLKIIHQKRKTFFQTSIFGFHVSFWGGNRCCVVFEMYQEKNNIWRRLFPIFGWLPPRCKLFGFRVVDAWFGILAFYMQQLLLWGIQVEYYHPPQKKIMFSYHSWRCGHFSITVSRYYKLANVCNTWSTLVIPIIWYYLNLNGYLTIRFMAKVGMEQFTHLGGFDWFQAPLNYPKSNQSNAKVLCNIQIGTSQQQL